MNSAIQVANFASKHLQSILDESGKILLSAAQTVRKGDLYILGLNPSGNPNDKHLKTIRQSLQEMTAKQSNDYIDEIWRKISIPSGLNWLVQGLGYDLRSVCASNLIFLRSFNDQGCRYPDSAHICWPVHEKMLRLVQPKMLLVFGNSCSSPSPFKFIWQLSGMPEVKTFPSGHGSWPCKAFRTQLCDQRVSVVGVPHLSRYHVQGKKDVVDWIKNYKSV